jgi:hypothetical protein
MTGALRHRHLGAVIDVVDGSRPGTVWLRADSHDGSTRWWLVDDTGEAVDWVPGAGSGLHAPRREDCVDSVCYRVATTTLRVERSLDGGATYSSEWEIDDDTYSMLAESYPDLENRARDLSSRSVVVHKVSGGHVVFVANGRDGLLYRDVDGEWHRLGFPGTGEGCCYYVAPTRIASDPQPRDLTRYAVGVVVAAVLLSGATAAIVRRSWRWSRALAVVAIAALAAYGTELAGHFPDVGMFPGWIYGVPLIMLILTGGVIVAVRVASGPPRIDEPSLGA